jgi:hypothetical protein
MPATSLAAASHQVRSTSALPTHAFPADALQADAATNFYVSPSGDNTDGRSWANAWSDLDRINWNVVQPGDTIILDGGASQQIYSTTLTIGKSGLPDTPITVRLSDEPGHDGKVIIDGGLTYWPCQATGPSPYTQNPPPGTRPYGLDLNGQSWIVVDGVKWGGIEIRNHNITGVRFHKATHVRLANLHIHHNTYPDVADGPGISISGDSILLEKLEINNNGQDAIQGGDLTNFVLQDSYLHDHYCSHPDGIQLYRGQNRNITIQRNVFTTGFLQAIFLGEQNPDLNSTTSDVHIFYNVIHNTRYGIVSNHMGNQNWQVFNNTIVDMDYDGISLYASAGGMEVRNNILYNGGYNIQNGVESNNIFYKTPYFPGGQGSLNLDPQFVDKANGDYQLQASSPAINAGIDVGLTSDFLRNIVPNGGGVDIGAFEYTPYVQTTATSTSASLTPTATLPLTATMVPASLTPTTTLPVSTTPTVTSTLSLPWPPLHQNRSTVYLPNICN